MKFAKIIAVVILLFGTSSVGLVGQQREVGSIFGYVKDRVSKTPIFYANVFILGTKWGTIADENGFYNIQNLPCGKYTIKVKMMGYKPAMVEGVIVKAGQSVRVDFYLDETVLPIETIYVEAERYQDETKISDRGFKSQDIKSPPGVMEDVNRALLVLPGVLSTSDLGSLLYVRGGSPDQNLVLLDGAETPNPYRLRLFLGGGISLFNPNFISSVGLNLGNFSVQYGNKSFGS